MEKKRWITEMAGKRNRLRWITAACCACLLLGGCSWHQKGAGDVAGGGVQANGTSATQMDNPDAAAKQTNNPDAVVVQADKPAEAVQKAPFVYPLTGKPSEAEVKSRPIMVMVENAPQARPQSGLDKADLVYEILAEGEITRFVAVYQSQSPAVIGPVRSIRPYFVQIGDGLDAVIVHAGWSQDAMNMIAQRNLSHFDEVYGDGAYYWRSSDRKAPHNLYTSLDKIRKGITAKKIRKDWNGLPLFFADKPVQPASAKPALQVTIPYLLGYNVSYTYDPASGLYKRFMEGKPHADKETGKQLTAANVLIVESKHKVIDGDGRRDVDVFGPETGYLLQRGREQEVVWERKGGMIRAYADGKELPLVPGTTWVQVVPEGTVPVWG